MVVWKEKIGLECRENCFSKKDKDFLSTRGKLYMALAASKPDIPRNLFPTLSDLQSTLHLHVPTYFEK